MPSVNACKCLKKVFDDNFPDVYAEVLPNGNKNPKEIEKTCAEQEKLGKSTVWLTVVKNTVGVTVKPWTYTVSLYGSGDSSLTSYIQYIFRAGSPGKDTFYSFDFCPERILDVADQFAQVRATKHNTSYDSEIAKVLNYLPLFAYNGVGGWESLETKNFFNSISKFSTIRATSNLIKDYLLELVEYEKELADVEVGSLNPQTSHNAEIGKLKKELLKKAQKSGKTDKEPSSKDLAEKLFQAFIDIYTFVKFANDSVESLDDFIKKLNIYDGECEDYFGFSDDFIKTLIAVMNSEKRCFEIAIQRFKHIDLKFAMEDVPDELAKRMIQKLDLKKGDTVCDWCCKGVGLLKNVPLGYKLYARVEDKRTELIVKKLLPNVNIVKDMTMKFDKMLINPPYDDLGNTVAEDIMDVARQHADKVVCLNQVNFFKSPYLKVKVKKDGGRANKFTDLLKHIENIETIPRNEFNKFFNIGGASDGAIIVLTKEETKYFDTFNESIFFKFCSEENSILSKANRDKQTPYYVVLKRQSYSVDDIDFIEDSDKHLGKDKRNFLPIYFDTENEKENFIKCYNTKFMKRFLQTLKSGKTTPIGLLPFMPTYAHPWTDEMLYEYFGLTEDEVKEIEQEIK